MNKIEELQHLNELHKNIKEFESIECKEKDEKVIGRAIKRVEKELREEAEEILLAISNGKKTINQVREEYGMEKIPDGKLGYMFANTNPIKRVEVTKEAFLPIISCENREDILTINIRNGIFTKGTKDLSNVSTDDLATELSKRQGALTIEKESTDENISKASKTLNKFINSVAELKEAGYKNIDLNLIVDKLEETSGNSINIYDIRILTIIFDKELKLIKG